MLESMPTTIVSWGDLGRPDENASFTAVAHLKFFATQFFFEAKNDRHLVQFVTILLHVLFSPLLLPAVRIENNSYQVCFCITTSTVVSRISDIIIIVV